MKIFFLFPLVAFSFSAYPHSHSDCKHFPFTHQKHRHKHHSQKSNSAQITPKSSATQIIQAAEQEAKQAQIPVSTQAMVPTSIVPATIETFDLDMNDLNMLYEEALSNPTGLSDVADTLACAPHELCQELPIQRATVESSNNFWTGLPAWHNIQVSCANAFDELKFNVYKHKVAIAATVTVALAAYGSYYWYKNNKAKKANKN